MKDFTKKRDQILFRIDEDVFEAAPALPAEVLNEFAGRFGGIGEVEDHNERFGIMTDVLDLVLLPDSYARFRSRLKDRAQPIELEQLSDILVWLVEQYGLRPTQPSSSSSAGPPSPEFGTNSTGGALPAASNSGLFLPTVS